MDKKSLDDLSALVDARNAIQKTRIQYSGRIEAIASGRDTATPQTRIFFEKTHERFAEIEQDHDDMIEDIARDIEIIRMATNVKGVGLLSISKIVSAINIEIADTVSSLWRYAGYSVDENGSVQKRHKGIKSDYNGELRTACYNLAVGLLRANSPYRSIYDESKEIYLGRGWTKMHAHLAAIRKMMKVFLQHLWITWRKLENLSVTDPYVFGVGNHSMQHYLKPEDFGWTDEPKKPVKKEKKPVSIERVEAYETP